MKHTLPPKIRRYNNKIILAGSLMLTAMPTLAANVNIVPSQQSPIAKEKTPMFVSFGFDDNVTEDGLAWVVDMLASYSNPQGHDTYAGKPLSASFFVNCATARGNEAITNLWKIMKYQGHDIGNHSESHPHDGAGTMTAEQWDSEIATCNRFLTASEQENGIGVEKVYGYRAPFLTYNDNSLTALINNGISYDVSFPAGISGDQNGTNNLWPYTLDNGSPDHDVAVNGGWKPAINHYPGLWEIPLHTLIVPPNNVVADYGLSYSLRDKIAARVPWFDTQSGKGDNFDWNLYSTPTYFAAGLNANDVLAIYKYNLDLRLAGNKAPLVLGLHSDFYGYLNGEEHSDKPETTVASRRSVLTQFIAYALSKPEVRFINHKQLIDWMVTPEPLTLCADKQWQPHDTNQKGDTVVFNDKTYVAKWWTSHQIPDLYPSSPWQALPHCIKQK
ncbi:polysaccharide deacetylase family protein [Photobacterium leiognathi]|uniref:polysaccharide deacetylase family protein n=1 Tax=Photobacterium leiognathi TaxID=553611 RepID=UPI00076A47DA|nr:polysaccharide deacetylase family protein [Photobacterium leiognathi]